VGNALPYPLIRDKLDWSVWRFMVANGCFECPEVVGKTILALRVYENRDEGNEVVIEFDDGTYFSCCVETKPVLTATLFRSCTGTPEVIRSYSS
jgi:hypothetical protein